MADVIHKTTLEYRRSVNTPDFPEEFWVHSPDMSAVVSVPSRYWKLSGSAVVEMTTGEKVAVDDAIAAASQSAAKSAADAAIDGLDGYELRAIAKIMVEEINSLRQWVTSFKAAVAAANSLGNLQTRVAALASMPDRTLAQAKTAYKNEISGTALDE
jgi:hypothetical protein